MADLLSLRKKAGMSQKEVAEKIFVCENTYRKWEQGKGEADYVSVNRLLDLYGYKNERTRRRFIDEYYYGGGRGRQSAGEDSRPSHSPPGRRGDFTDEELMEAWDSVVEAVNRFDRMLKKSGNGSFRILDGIFTDKDLSWKDKEGKEFEDH